LTSDILKGQRQKSLAKLSEIPFNDYVSKEQLAEEVDSLTSTVEAAIQSS